MKSGRLAIGLAIGLLVILLDQATKNWILFSFFGLDEPVTAGLWVPGVQITPFLNLVLVWNPGVSFGMLGGAPEISRWLLTGLALAISAVLLVWLSRAASTFLAVALGLIIGGAIGNAIDRLRFGAVVDFIDIHWMGYHFWAFNIADAAISIGVVLIILDSLIGERRARPRDARSQE